MKTLSESSVCLFVWCRVSDLFDRIRTVIEMSFHSASQMPTEMSHGIAFVRLVIPQIWQSLHLVESCCRKSHKAVKTMRSPSDILKHLRGLESARGDTQILCGFLSPSACLRTWHSQKSSPDKIDLDGQKCFGSSIQFLLWLMANGPLSTLHVSSLVQSSVMELRTSSFVWYAEMRATWEHPQEQGRTSLLHSTLFKRGHDKLQGCFQKWIPLRPRLHRWSTQMGYLFWEPQRVHE